MNGIYKLHIPLKYVISYPAMDGSEQNPDYNLMIAKYCNNIILRGWKTESVGDMGISSVKSLIVDEFLLVLNFGGKVEFFSPLVKVAEADIDNQIPEGLSNRTYPVIIDDSDPANPITEERVHTWRSWRDTAHPLGSPIEGSYYFMSASFGKVHVDTELLIIHMHTDSTLVDAAPIVDDPIIE